MQPKAIDVNPDHLLITWEDGHVGRYAMDAVRRLCRCAGCVHEITGQPLLDPKTVADKILCVKAEPVGHYAISLNFSDGHATGIYGYDYLRSLCPCPACQQTSQTRAPC